MEINNGDINSFYEKANIEELFPTKINNYLITKDNYQSEET